MANRPNILVVDDHLDTLEMVATFLQLEGYAVRKASDGAAGLDQAREARPCVILLDLMMPGVDGPEFRRRQLDDDAISEVPVICMSGHHDAPGIARRITASACLTKPIDFTELLSEIWKLCGPPPSVSQGWTVEPRKQEENA